MSDRDNIYFSDKVKNISFSFNEEVTKVFSDMINRSVPGYISSLNLIKQYGRKYHQPDTYIYDLGCSLGSVTASLLPLAKDRNKIIGVDNSVSMINSCKKNFSSNIKNGEVDFHHQDVRDLKMKKSSFIVVNYLMQFLKIPERNDLLRNIHNILVENGVCILSEKIHFSSSLRTNLIKDIHHSFKLQNGYTALEIARKRDALEGVLVTETEEEHIMRLIDIGFKVTKIMSNLNFITLLCKK